MPAGLDQDDPAAGHESGLEIVLVTFAGAGADQRRVRFVAALHRIVDDEPVGAVAGHGRLDAGRHIFGTVGERPGVGGALLAAERGAKKLLVMRRAHDRARAPPMLARQIGAVGREDDARAGIAPHQECRQHHRAVGRLGRAGRHQDHGAAVRPLDRSLDRLEQEPVMRRERGLDVFEARLVPSSLAGRPGTSIAQAKSMSLARTFSRASLRPARVVRIALPIGPPGAPKTKRPGDGSGAQFITLSI